MARERQEPFQFTIAINDVALDLQSISRIEQRLGEMMLEELAKLDGEGDLVARPLPTARSIGGPGGGIAGRFISRG